MFARSLLDLQLFLIPVCSSQDSFKLLRPHIITLSSVAFKSGQEDRHERHCTSLLARGVAA